MPHGGGFNTRPGPAWDGAKASMSDCDGVKAGCGTPLRSVSSPPPSGRPLDSAICNLSGHTATAGGHQYCGQNADG